MTARTALFVVTTLLFVPTLASYPDVWRAQPFTHGYLIAAATVWLVWRERDVLREPAVEWTAPLLVAAGLSLVWFAAVVTNARVVAQTAVPLILLLWVGAALGRRAAGRLAPVAAIFMLAVPLWGALTRPLQAMTIAANGLAMSLLRIPAQIDGDLVHLASGSFVIEGGCAGVNYLLSGLTIGALYAHIFADRWRARLTVVALAAGVAIVGNWVRVSTLIAIGHATRMESIFVTEPRPHLYYGWGVFFAGLLLFFPLAGLVARRDAAGAPREADAADRGGSARAHRASPALRPAVLATVAAGIGPALYYLVGALPAREVAPLSLAGSSSEWSLIEESAARPYTWEPAFEGADERRTQVWSDGAARVVVDRIVYRDQSQGAELIGFTSRIAPADDVLLERLFGTVGPERRIVNEAVVRDPSAPLLVWYWYRVGGIETASPAKAKLLELWAFLARSTGSELIAVSLPCALDSCEGASRTLRAFLDDS